MIRQIKINDKMNAEVVNQIDKTTITLSIDGKAIITFSAPIYKGVSYDIVYDDNYFEIYSKQKDLKENIINTKMEVAYDIKLNKVIKNTFDTTNFDNKLIVIEGACDGIGKTTQYDELYKHLIMDGNSVYRHHFPSYGTPQGAPVEQYLKGELGNIDELSPYFINSLYATDRGVTWYNELKKEFLDGKIILLDRYTTSSLIYQSALIDDVDEKKRFIDYVLDFEYNKIGIKEPDNVIFLHAPFDLVTCLRKARITNEGVSNDIHEKDLTFMRKVYDSALFVADYLSWDKVECSIDNKMKSIEEIHEEVYKLIKK